MALRYKMLTAVVVIAAFIVAPVASFVVIHSADAPPPEDADLLVRPPAVPEEENAFPLLLEAGDAIFWLTDRDWLDGPPPEGASEDALTDRDRLEAMVGGKEWDEGLAEAVLGRNREALALLDRAMARPHLQIPALESVAFEIPYIYGFLQLAKVQALQSRAQVRNAQAAQAVETALKTVELGDRLERGSNCAAAYLVGLTIRGQGLLLLRDLAAKAPLAADDMRRVADRLAELPPQGDALAGVWRAEYRVAADAVGRVRRGELSIDEVTTVPGLSMYLMLPTPYRLHPNRTRCLFADTFRTYCEAARKPYWEARLDMEVLQRRLDRQCSATDHWWSPFRPNVLGEALYFGLIPAGDWVTQAKARSILIQRVTRLLLLLRAWKADHGRLPEILDALVPAFMEAVPLDPFDGGPVRYDREKRILYSAGKDGVGTGGMSEDEQQTWWKNEDPDAAAGGHEPNVWEMPDPSFPIRF